jgi:putative hydrolase of the HAD superfamily
MSAFCGSDDSISKRRILLKNKLIEIESRTPTESCSANEKQHGQGDKVRKKTGITCLFVDIGGVLLTNGWDHHARKQAATNFKLELAEMENRHNQAFDTYELGKLTIEEYLSRVVFYEERPFTPAQFRKFMFAQSKPYPKMIELVRRLKIRYGLKIVVVSNEARELNSHRIRKFKLDEFVDFFISSCFVHLRKPDADIFRIALDISQVPANQVAYIENLLMFVQVAEGLGIRGICHTDYKSTCAKLASFGLEAAE